MSSPLGVVEKAREPGKFRVVRDLSFRNDDGYSVNGQLDSDDFPTEWGTASQVADIVSYLHLAPFGFYLYFSSRFDARTSVHLLVSTWVIHSLGFPIHCHAFVDASALRLSH